MFYLSTIYSNPFFRLLEFLIGVILASIYNDKKESELLNKILNKRVALVVSVLMIIGVSLVYRLNFSRGNYMLYSWICLPCFCLIIPSISALQVKVQGIKYKLLLYGSSISYCVFLAQYFVWPIIRKLKLENNVIKIFVVYLLCLAIAIFLYEIVEKPSKKMLTRRLLS